jgi:uncharacterized protein
MLNYPEKSWMSPKVEVRESSIGQGMYAKESIQAGEKVVVFGGASCNTEEAKEWANKGKLIMQWDNDLWTYEDSGDDETYFINHSCDGNLWMEDISTLTARRDIAAGEEITADYALWEADEDDVKPWVCQCGSQLCRHRITGQDYKIVELQERYKGHFSKLINDRISNLKD